MPEGAGTWRGGQGPGGRPGSLSVDTSRAMGREGRVLSWSHVIGFARAGKGVGGEEAGSKRSGSNPARVVGRQQPQEGSGWIGEILRR